MRARNEESAIMSEAQGTVTIKNGGGIVNDRLSRNTETGQSELQSALHSAGRRMLQKHRGEGLANSKCEGSTVAAGK